MVKRICLIIAAFLAIQLNVYAGPLYSVQTRQIYCFSDIMRTYMDIEDQSGSPAAKPERSAIVGYIDGTKLTTSSVSRFGDTGEGVADIFLVDISGSLKDEQMVNVRAAIKTWVSNMKEKDRIAVMTFGTDVNTLIDFSGDKNAINKAVDRITNNDKNTQLYGGISQALKLAARNDTDLPKRKNIVLITDGVNDYSGGISESDVYSQLKKSLIPVYSMWMPGTDKEKGRGTLNSVAEYSGGTMYDMAGKSIDTVYGWIRDSVQNSYTVDFSYGGAQADNSAHTFKARVAENGKVAEDSVEFTMQKTDEESGTYRIGSADVDAAQTEEEDSGEKDNKLLFIIIGIAALLAAAAAIAAVVIMRGRNAVYEERDTAYDVQPVGYTPPAQTSNKTVNVNYNTIGTVGESGGGAKLVLRSASGKTFSAEITDKITIGRDKKCNIVLGAPTVSAAHASVIIRNGRLCLEDLHSANGTLVNGRLITAPTEINSGDKVIFGSEEYTVSF